MPETFCDASGKIAYPSKISASRARAQFGSKFKRANKAKYGELTAFKCNACGLWHLGRIHLGRKKRWSV